MAADLVRRRVSVIVANTPANLVAKKATDTIPIVFTTASDPVQIGLVPNLSRPGGNVTGVSQLNVEIGPKRLELARELMPAATTVAFLVNPSDGARAGSRRHRSAVIAGPRRSGDRIEAMSASGRVLDPTRSPILIRDARPGGHRPGH
jgi:putative ABC transport system substrate-binding protein